MFSGKQLTLFSFSGEDFGLVLAFLHLALVYFSGELERSQAIVEVVLKGADVDNHKYF